MVYTNIATEDCIYFYRFNILIDRNVQKVNLCVRHIRYMSVLSFPNLTTICFCACYMPPSKDWDVILKNKGNLPLLQFIKPRFDMEKKFVLHKKMNYFLQWNRNKVQAAILFYLCIRKCYSLIDKNITKRICRDFVMNYVEEQKIGRKKLKK